jgi:hypothetical protein
MSAAIAINGPVRARIEKTGVMKRASKKYTLPVLLFVIFDGAIMLAALGYFSWAHLGWWPLLTFFAVYFSVGDRLGRLDSELGTWIVMAASVVVVAVMEWLLWVQ